MPPQRFSRSSPTNQLFHSTVQTEDQTWFDRKQKKIRNWADRTSGKIDNWFGEVDPQNLHQPPFGIDR